MLETSPHRNSGDIPFSRFRIDCPDFATTGMLESLRVALPHVRPGPLLVCHRLRQLYRLFSSSKGDEKRTPTFACTQRGYGDIIFRHSVTFTAAVSRSCRSSRCEPFRLRWHGSCWKPQEASLLWSMRRLPARKARASTRRGHPVCTHLAG